MSNIETFYRCLSQVISASIPLILMQINQANAATTHDQLITRVAPSLASPSPGGSPTVPVPFTTAFAPSTVLTQTLTGTLNLFTGTGSLCSPNTYTPTIMATITDPNNPGVTTLVNLGTTKWADFADDNNCILTATSIVGSTSLVQGVIFSSTTATMFIPTSTVASTREVVVIPSPTIDASTLSTAISDLADIDATLRASNLLPNPAVDTTVGITNTPVANFGSFKNSGTVKTQRSAETGAQVGKVDDVTAQTPCAAQKGIFTFNAPTARTVGFNIKYDDHIQIVDSTGNIIYTSPLFDSSYQNPTASCENGPSKVEFLQALSQGPNIFTATLLTGGDGEFSIEFLESYN